jgi:hypothetical protein
MWPFVVRQPAQRASRNRPRGAIVTTPINVDYETYLEYMLEKVLPAIKQNFPQNHFRDGILGIQHGNAPVHFGKRDPEWLAYINAEEN